LADALGYDWPSLLAGATWLHVTGITPALGQAAAAATRLAVQTAAGMGVTVSCDLNYRSALWSREQAGAFMGPLMEHVDLCIANEQDAADVFGVKAAGADVESGVLDPAGYADVARQLAARFGLRQVAITLRGSVSASRNTWSAMLYSAGQAYFAPTYDLAIVDRVGGGDSFAGALIHALSAGMPNQEALDFAVAASALKHSIEHDFNLVTVAEVESLAAGNVSGRVQR
jgi:2-dehydro-3-deoxygluconokinase